MVWCLLDAPTLPFPAIENQSRESRASSNWQAEIFSIKEILVDNVSLPLARSRLSIWMHPDQPYRPDTFCKPSNIKECVSLILCHLIAFRRYQFHRICASATS